MKVSFLNRSKKLLLTTLLISTLSIFSSSNAFELEDLTEDNLASWEWHKENFENMFKQLVTNMDDYDKFSEDLCGFYAALLKDATYDNHDWSELSANTSGYTPLTRNATTSKSVGNSGAGNYIEHKQNRLDIIQFYFTEIGDDIAGAEIKNKREINLPAAKIQNIPMSSDASKKLTLVFWITKNRTTPNIVEINDDDDESEETEEVKIVNQYKTRTEKENWSKSWDEYILGKAGTINRYLQNYKNSTNQVMDNSSHISVQYKLSNGEFITVNIALLVKKLPAQETIEDGKGKKRSWYEFWK